LNEHESKEKDDAGRPLLWDCFVNWANTLEKLERREPLEDEPRKL